MFNVLRSFRNTDVSPTTVIDVNTDNYKDRHIVCREDCLVLYEPQTSQDKNERPKYEIVLHRPCTETLHQAYSLFRSEEKDEAEIKFICFKDTIPIFIEIRKEALIQNSNPPHCLNSRNINGYTPLHMACLADKTDCLKAFLLTGADVNIAESQEFPDETAPGYVGDLLQDHSNSLYLQDMKFGGTPLHWACSRGDIDALVDMNCNVNTVNFEQRTALHIMVLRNRFECLVALLCRKADPDLRDFEGNAPLHFAVKQSNIPMIQCLIIFGANLDIVNNNGYTPRHLITTEQESEILYYLHAVGAKRCPEGIPECTEGCSFNGTFDGVPPIAVIGPPNGDVLNQMLNVDRMKNNSKSQDTSKKHGRLLCLDGGGIRGLILIQLLLELEKVAEVPINNCFDWIAGTSTGGILALGLATGKTLKECMFLYFRMKEFTFVGLRPYSSEAFENILKDAFGIDSVMSDIEIPKVLITGCLSDRKPLELHLFRNYKSPNSILDIKHDSPYELPAPPEEQLIWHVCRSTGAAPTYFRAFGRFLDGGLIANNPTLDAMTEIREYNTALRAVVVSLGTGLVPLTKLGEIDTFNPDSFWDMAKLLLGMSLLGSILVDQITATDGRVVDRARGWCSTIGVPYFRYSPQMSENISFDEKSDEKLYKMLWEAKSYMHANLTSLKEVADILMH